MGKEAEETASADFVVEDPDFTEDELQEADEYTQAKLKEAGMLPDEEAETPEIQADALESESETAPEQEHPQEEPIAEEAEPTLILGKYRTQEDLERAYQEANSKLTQTTQQLSEAQQAQQLIQELARRDDGRRILTDLAMGVQRQPEPQLQIPDGQDFYDWLGQDKKNLDVYLNQQNKPLHDTIRQQGEILNSVLGFLEEQVTEKKYGTTLQEMKPYLDEAAKALGDRFNYYPIEDRLLIAEGIKAKADAHNGETQRQQQAKQEQIQQEHRAKVKQAQVETADETTSVGRVVDIKNMSSAEIKKHLKSLGVEYHRRD